MSRTYRCVIVWTLLLVAAAGAQVSRWQFGKTHFTDGVVTDRIGDVHGRLDGRARFFADSIGEYLELDGASGVVHLGRYPDGPRPPVERISVETLARFRQFGDYMGVIGAFQDNGDYERGWVLGARRGRPFFAVASEGAKSLTYLQTAKSVEAGKWYHLVGTYDGKVHRLFVNGQLANESTVQQGKILYPSHAWYTIGAYRDDNEFDGMIGSLRMVAVYDEALGADRVRSRFEEVKASTELPAEVAAPSIISVGPYLQYATKTGITILWETSQEATSVVEFGEQTPLTNSVSAAGQGDLHEVRLENLKPQTNYFYRVVSVGPDGTESISDLYTFQTAVEDGSAFAFAGVSDTQNNPPVWGRISQLVFKERPNFLIHAGDIVGNGSRRHEWTDEFLKPAHELMSRVPIFAILGNHDQDDANYYRYISNPAPEYRYTFTYGNAQFFLIDTNRSVAPDSEQYKWLEQELARSTATWKFTVHHHPPYSSDENDYGDTWKGKSSPRGDLRLRPLVELYERFGVDICFFGHIHDYERTWPIRKDTVDPHGGVIYLQIGGAGGGLENYAPTRSWFTAKVRRDHHFVLVNVFGKTLQLQAIDQNGVLFDQVTLEK
ncbi:MAG: metallophosphoesterase [Sedimentisphaerales bacterium]|jgi:predicted phosphodiesterase|nr:metallophosphoesterase [Sedimentisphaerales bacterium]NLT75818.1 metallophosphoesterase [Planctomycetota bacterium]